MFLRISLIFFALIILIACSEQKNDNASLDTTAQDYDTAMQENPGDNEDVTQATAVLNPTQNNKASGTVTFIKDGDNMKVIADIQGLTPGKHGFHIHENGDCSAPDASTAGGHFNPEGHEHGDMGMKSHAGDFGNLIADKSGRAKLEFTSAILKFTGPESILNRSVVVHQDPDDLKSQPAGKSGPRIACGVISQDNTGSQAKPQYQDGTKSPADTQKPKAK